MENFHDIILNSNHQDQEPLFFSSFPSPFFDDTAPSKNHTHQHKPPCLNITSASTEPLPCESKRLIKKRRSVGKKDRHSKIHTAQGLRDRRMRLSLEIARKFFSLQDLLGFDKASNTIEWLFSKSNKAIKEVAQNFDHPQSHEETKSCISKPEKIKQQVPNNNNNNNNSSSVVISREEKRARARDRTRERMMMKQLEKSSSKLFPADHIPKDEIYKLGLGCLLGSPSVEELGFISSTPSELLQDSSSSPSFEYSGSTLHPNCLRQLQSTTIDNVINYSFENYSGQGSSSIINVGTSTAAGWLNYSNGGMPGEWDAATADRFISEYYNNYEITPTSTLTGDIYEQNPSSFFMSSTTTTTNILHF